MRRFVNWCLTVVRRIASGCYKKARRCTHFYLPILIVIAIGVACFAIYYSSSKESVGLMAGVLGLLLRQEYADRKARQSRHTIQGKLDDIKTAADEVKETAAVVVRQTNGELDEKIESALKRHLTPLVNKVAVLEELSGKLEKLDQYVHDFKHEIAGKAHAELLRQQLQERGIDPEKP